MFAVTVLISGSEWGKIREVATRLFPGETLSGSEVIRRFTMAGVKALKNAAPADRDRQVHDLKGSMHADDTRLNHLWHG